MLNSKKKKQKLNYDKENIDQSKETKYYFNQGKLKLDKSKTNEQILEAIDFFNIAIQKSNNSQGISVNNIYNMRGQAYFKLKNYEKAQKDFNQAIHLSDQKSKIPFLNYLGKCKIQMSYSQPIQLQQAYRYFEKAIELSGKTDGQSYFNLGYVNKLMNKTNAAIKQFSNAIKFLKSSELFDVYFNRGLCYQDLHQIENSIEDFLKACQIKKDDANSQFHLGLSYIQLKNYQLALERFNKAIQLNSKQPKYYNYKAVTLSLNQQYQYAIIQFNKALTLYPFYQASQCWYNKGSTLIKINKLQEALQSFQKSLEPIKVQESLLIKIFYSKGLIYQKLNKIEALQCFQNCLNLIKDYSHELYLSTLYHLGINQFRNNCLRQAILSFTKIFQNGCTDKCVYESRGKVYLELQQFEEALKDFQKVSEIDPIYSDIYYYKGKAKNNLDKIEQAIEDFHHCLELGSRNISVFNGIGQSYLKLKKYQKALYYLNIALQKSPLDEEFLVQRSRIYLEINQHQKAIDDLTKALHQKPTNATIYYRRGLAYYKHKMFNQAIKDLYKAFQFKPRQLIQPDIHYHLGISYANLSEFQKAIEPLTKAIALSPEPKYYHQRAKCYLLIDKNIQALNDFNEVIKKQPDNAYAYFRRAFAHKALKRYDQTADDFQTARKLKPNDPKLFINKKQVYSIKYKKLCDPGEQI